MVSFNHMTNSSPYRKTLDMSTTDSPKAKTPWFWSFRGWLNSFSVIEYTDAGRWFISTPILNAINNDPDQRASFYGNSNLEQTMALLRRCEAAIPGDTVLVGNMLIEPTTVPTVAKILRRGLRAYEAMER